MLVPATIQAYSPYPSPVGDGYSYAPAAAQTSVCRDRSEHRYGDEDEDEDEGEGLEVTRSKNPAVIDAARRIRGYMRPYPHLYTRRQLQTALELPTITARRALDRLRDVEGSVELVEGRYYRLREGFRAPALDEPNDLVLCGLHLAVALLHQRGLQAFANEIEDLLEDLDLRARQQRAVVTLGATSRALARSSAREDRSLTLLRLVKARAGRRRVRLALEHAAWPHLDCQVRGLTIGDGEIVVNGVAPDGRCYDVPLDSIEDVS